MNKDVKYPVRLIDADSAPHVLPADALLDMRNIRLVSGKNKDVGFFKSIKGNIVLTGSTDVPDGSTGLGGCFDPTGTYIVWLTKNVNPSLDQINYFNVVTNEYWLVLRSEMDAIGKVFGGLNFTKFVHSMQIINDTLYWTDNNEEPRKLHIGAAIRATYPTLDNTPLYPGWQYAWTNLPFFYVDKSAITMICKPPAYPPVVVKSYDPNIENNFIFNESFQFAAQYEYYSGERSVLSLWSESTDINYAGEKNNYINVYLRQDDVPTPSAVRSIRLVVKVFSTGRCFVIKSWDKEVPSEADQIFAFSAGGQLSYRFFYKFLGEVIDENTYTKPFDSVPIKAEGQSVIKNRIFYGNTVEGYSAPEKRSSLQIKIVDANAPDEIGITVPPYWGNYMWDPSPDNHVYYSAWFVYLAEGDVPGVSQTGFYSINSSEDDSLRSADQSLLPDAVSISDLTFRGDTDIAVFENLSGSSIGDIWFWHTLNHFRTHAVRFISGEDLDGITQKSLLHNNETHAGIVFYDKYLRRCSVIVPYNYDSDAVLPGEFGPKVYLPIRDNTLTGIYTLIEWALDNTSAVDEIPDWAVYYAPVVKGHDRLSYFVGGISTASKYAKRGTDTDYDFTDTTFSDTNTVAIGLDSSSLVNAGLGYTYSEGDICVIVKPDNSKYELPVIGQSGKYILVSAKNIGDISTAKLIYEIYTPLRSDNEQLFYEVGQLYAITNPGSDTRQYSILSGYLYPDAWFIYRTFNTSSYYAQAMSPNDTFYRMWVSNFGKANVITKQGQQRKLTNISFSNTYIPGSSVNGLSSFEALNEANISPEYGPIRKLISTNKITGDGNVLLAICENATASVYIDEAELSDQSGNSVLVKSEKVIGQTNDLRGGYGTKHPESVAEINGNVYWWDNNRAAFVKYSTNGLFPLSDQGLKAVSYDLSLRTGDDVLVIGGIDPYNFEYMVQPQFDDSTGSDYRLKMSGNTTIIICLSENKCRGIDEYFSEGFVNNGRDTYSFKNGQLWKMEESDAHSVFFGVPVVPSIAMASNAAGSDIKVFESIGIKVNEAPDRVLFMTADPNYQESDLVKSDFKSREGVLYAALQRDYYSPNTTGNADEKRTRGDKLRGAYMFFRIEYPSGKEIRMKDLFVNYNLSAGHGNR